MKRYDYVVVGGGSAGCVLANRLSASGAHRVLLLEAGSSDWNPLIHIPIGWTQISYAPAFNWGNSIEPEASTAHRRMYWPRGKILGGCSSINGMIHIRGHREDFDNWRAAGCDGWGWDDVLPYFERSERFHEGTGPVSEGGALGTSEVEHSEVSDLFIRSCEARGLANIGDFNRGEQEGVAYYRGNIVRGRRQSTARCYLKPARGRANLDIVTGALCQRILFDGRRATGVQAEVKGANTEYRAGCAVILAAGAINSPQLLQLSGVGPAALLRQHGIEVVAELPGVGQNLKDHLGSMVAYQVSGVRTVWTEMNPVSLARQLYAYLRHRKGLLSFPSAHVGAFYRSGPEQERPDIQLFFMPVGGTRDDKNRTVMDRESAVTAMIQHVRPQSTGSVTITGKAAGDLPRIHANYLGTEYDCRSMVAGFREMRRIFEQQPIAAVCRREIRPGKHLQSDAEILAYIRSEATTGYHPVGTCRMGTDPLAVVDPDLRVHGLAGLRVVDASVMPDIIAGNTNAATVMIAEKASDLILRQATN